jgi:hypothetical protein
MQFLYYLLIVIIIYSSPYCLIREERNGFIKIPIFLYFRL